VGSGYCRNAYGTLMPVRKRVATPPPPATAPVSKGPHMSTSYRLQLVLLAEIPRNKQYTAVFGRTSQRRRRNWTRDWTPVDTARWTPPPAHPHEVVGRFTGDPPAAHKTRRASNASAVSERGAADADVATRRSRTAIRRPEFQKTRAARGP